MSDLGRVLMLLGGIIVVLGALIYTASRLGFLFGSLPGDIQVKQGNLTCIVPIVSSIVLSVVLTIIFNIVIRYLNR